MSHVSNNTDKINAWAGDVNTTADDYDTLVSRLYALVDMFANSEDFKEKCLIVIQEHSEKHLDI